MDAVRAERLVRDVIQYSSGILTVCGKSFPISQFGRIAVVGAGKAGAGMAAAIEGVLGSELVDARVTGWINVPADCVRPLRKIHLHAARPAGVNEPTEAGVEGARKILEIVSHLEPGDLCFVLISGGGSALLPAPIPQISLADKQAVTRFLMQSGATIFELNTVRKQLSQIKGGRLARAIRARTAMTLIISDVVGDPLDVIASGPTVLDTGTPAEAFAVLRKFGARPPAVPQAVFDALEQAAAGGPDAIPRAGRVETFAPPQSPRERGDEPAPSPFTGRVGVGGVESVAPSCAVETSLLRSISNHVIGNNAVAVAAATSHAIELGYSVRSFGSDNQGEADEVGRELAEMALSIRAELNPADKPVCVISGGEPIVRLTQSERRGKGGRNQQLVLAAVDRLWDEDPQRVAILSGGTDGEDGPTDAAGAYADAEVLSRARAAGLSPREFLEHNDAYRFFDEIGGLIQTGPTHTNVMDLRVALVASTEG